MSAYFKNLSRRFVPSFLGALFLAIAPRTQAQTWATNTPLQVARWHHTATLLTNGTVLIAGGVLYNTNGISGNTSGCELYNPSLGSSSNSAAMHEARDSYTATLLPNGRVLAAGGTQGDPTSEIYDPVSASWSALIPMNAERSVHTATLLASGKVLVAGGYDNNSGNELSSGEVFNPASGTWTATGPMPFGADTEAAALLPNGKVLVCGGSTNGNSISNAAIYDPASNTWTGTAPMKDARAGHTATLLPNGKVFVEGGGFLSSAEVYDPVAATWTYVASSVDGHLYPRAVLLSDGTVMVCADNNTDVEVYDPIGDSWSFVDSMIVPGQFQTATLLPSGKVLVTGGSESEYNGPPEAVVQTYGSTVLIPGLTVTASPLSGPAPLTVQFTSPGVDNGGHTVTNWLWDFGDGRTSALQSPLHVYTNLGSFSPSLTARSTYDSAPLNVTGPGTINVTTPTLNVTASPQVGLVPLTVQFTSPAVDSSSHSVTNWSWAFGDGVSSAAQSPAHTYTNLGLFSPSLVARSTYGSATLTVSGPGTINVTNNSLTVTLALRPARPPSVSSSPVPPKTTPAIMCPIGIGVSVTEPPAPRRVRCMFTPPPGCFLPASPLIARMRECLFPFPVSARSRSPTPPIRISARFMLFRPPWDLIPFSPTATASVPNPGWCCQGASFTGWRFPEAAMVLELCSPSTRMAPVSRIYIISRPLLEVSRTAA